jgi:transposase
MLREEKNKKISEILNDIPLHQREAIQALFTDIIHENDLKIANLEKELSWLKEQIKLGKQRQYGRSSEKTQSLQTEIIFNEGDESEAAAHNLSEETETVTYTRRKAKQCGRKLDTSKLPRERQIYDLSESEKICTCGGLLEKFAEDISEQVDYIPEQLKVIEHVRPKYTCRQCETVKSATKPEFPIAKCMATGRLITDVVIKKYEQHLPLYRQSKIFISQGFEIPDNTLGNWMMGAAEVLLPLGEALWQQIPDVRVLQVDETPVTVLHPHKEGYMWVYHSCDRKNRFILFEFTLTRAGENPTRRLKDYKGLVQTDGYSGYNHLRNHSDIINFGCWDHARRKFSDVVKVNGKNKSGKAGDMLVLIAKLYEVEDEAKNWAFEERKKIRQTKSKPVLNLIHSKLQTINAPPQSVLGKAVQYCLNQWTYLSRYVDYGEVEISNCWIENQIRPFALGRRNWLFVGNEVSANKSALLYTLIQTCKLNKINPRHYLEYVLNQVHKIRRREIDPTSLLPQFINKNLIILS